MDCPFDILQHIDAWQGTATHFHTGVILAEPVLGKQQAARIRREGNSYANSKKITEAVKERRVRVLQQIERLRERLAAYDAAIVPKRKVKKEEAE